MKIAGYILCVVNYICVCAGRYCRQKKHIVMFELLAKVFTVVSLYCLGSLTGAYMFFVSLVNLIVCNINEHRGTGTKVLYYVFETAYIAVTILTFKGISSVLVFTTSSITLYCLWFLNPQQMRLLGIVNSCIFTMYQISIGNIAGMLEVFVLVSNLTAFVHYRKEMKPNEEHTVQGS